VLLFFACEITGCGWLLFFIVCMFNFFNNEMIVSVAAIGTS